MPRFLLPATLISFAFALPCLAGAAPSTPEDEIRQVVARYMTARNHQDLAALQALFTPDADQLVSTGVWRRGLDELLKGAMASSKKENGQSSVTLESVRLLGPDTAIADGRYETSASGAPTVRKMWSTFVLRRIGDEWRIAAIRNMLPAEH